MRQGLLCLVLAFLLAGPGLAHVQDDGSPDRDTEALLDRVREANRSFDRAMREAEREKRRRETRTTIMVVLLVAGGLGWLFYRLRNEGDPAQ